MKYEDVKTPDELLEFMNVIEYGFVAEDGSKYGAWDEDGFEKNVVSKWRLSSPLRLLNVGYGHCFDQVELERDWFKSKGYNFKTFYILFAFDEPNDYSTHTFLVYEDEGCWKLFEHADYFNRGIHTFNTLEEALKFEMKSHIEVNRKYNKINKEVIEHLCIIEYEKPSEHVDFQGFINHVLDHGKEVSIKLD